MTTPAGFSSAARGRYPPGEDIRIICAELPQEKRALYSDPDSPDYVRLYRFADPEALLELYAHIRAVNPTSSVRYRTAPELRASDYTNHLVLIGGVDWNAVTGNVLGLINPPVEQIARETDSVRGAFRVGDTKFEPVVSGNKLLEDVAHFYTGPNPFNRKRSVTICNGMFARGTFGVVRALTDEKFKDRNREYLRRRFAGAPAFSIISRVPIVSGLVVTPDWTDSRNRLHEWPEVRGEGGGV